MLHTLKNSVFAFLAHFQRGDQGVLKIAAAVFCSTLSLSAIAVEPKSAATYEPPTKQEADKTDGRQQPPEPPAKNATNAAPQREQGQQRLGQRFLDFTLTDVLLAAFTGVLVAVGWLQWKALGRSVDIGGKAADAAARLAKITVNVERPFVESSDIDLIRVPLPNDPNQEQIDIYEIVVSYTNYGRTPAFILRIGHGETIAENPPAEPVYRFYDYDVVIKPGETHRFQPYNLLSIKPAEREAIAKNKAFVWMWGQIRYRNFFNGITEVGFVAFQYPEVRVGDKVFQTAGFRRRGFPAYAYQRYYDDESGLSPAS